MTFNARKDGRGVLVIEVDGQLIVGNRQELKQMVLDALEAGDDKRARAIYQRLLPLLTIEWLYGASVYKEVLRRRGVIQSTVTRDAGLHKLDELDHKELDAILADVGELFTATAP